MDFLESLCDLVSDIPGLPCECVIGYPEEEKLTLYSLPGGRVIETFMDGSKVERLNYEITMKSISPSKINTTLWKVKEALEQVKEIKSNNNSFEFLELTITNTPFPNQIDEKWSVFVLDIQVDLMIEEEY